MQGGSNVKGMAIEAAKAIDKIFEDLLKPEDTHESMPYEFTYKGYMRKKKKQLPRHKR